MLNEAIKPFLTAPVATYVTRSATTITTQITDLMILTVFGARPLAFEPISEYLSLSFLISAESFSTSFSSVLSAFLALRASISFFNSVLLASFFSRTFAALAAFFSADFFALAAFLADLSSALTLPPVNKSSSNCFFAIFSSYLFQSNLIHKIFYTIFVNITRIILFFPKLYAHCCKHHTKIILFTALCISSRT